MKFHHLAQSSLAALSILCLPHHSFATTAPEAPYCVAVSGGFGHSGGSTLVARNFTIPEASKCSTWSGYTKTAATVILTTGGTACMSSDSLALTVSVSSADPDYLGVGTQAADYIKMSRAHATDSFAGTDAGYLMGYAEQISCTNDLLTLPASHD
jgi:hypothetical protein